MMTARPADLTPEAKAMLTARCPRCRRGNMFAGGPYHFGANRIRLDCPACRLTFEIEPGYFYAAMYVSYALNVAEGLTLAMLTWLLTGNRDSPWLYLTVILTGLLVLSPLNFRYSRVILLYWLSPKIHYRPELDRPAPDQHS